MFYLTYFYKSKKLSTLAGDELAKNASLFNWIILQV